MGEKNPISRRNGPKLFDAIVASFKAAIRQPDMVEFGKAMRSARPSPELERAVYQRTVFQQSRRGGLHVRRRGARHYWNTRRMYFAGNVTAACFRSTPRRRMCQTKIKSST
jgi:hypothetical protein